MKGHVELIAIAEVSPRIFWPLIGFSEKHAIWELVINVRS